LSGEPQVVDPAALERLRGWGGPPLVAKMIELFRELGPQRLQEVEVGLAAEDLNRVASVAHSFKSSAGNLGADHLRLLCAALEAAAEEGRREESLRLAAELPGAFRATIVEVEALQGSPPEDESGGTHTDDNESGE
jgi:HPt (histidine-containing phosphotransfer) domain-containing protein